MIVPVLFNVAMAFVFKSKVTYMMFVCELLMYVDHVLSRTLSYSTLYSNNVYVIRITSYRQFTQCVVFRDTSPQHTQCFI